ncbi:hypothetical protein S40293_00763 [Stachybotrys chartarum IBT 40293]|nr:hypothetical protein S40293_00763 [Stachybotrys chartarum IBT 40293]
MIVSQTTPRGVIFDLGDVLFAWSANTTTSIPARKLRDILSTPTWYSYDRGEITRDACFETSARNFALSASEIAQAFAQARKSLEPNAAIVSLILQLKQDPEIRVFAMSNIGKEDFDELGDKMDWLLFDRVFTSAAAGMRKPELGFYRHVLDHIGLAGNQVVFVDDKEENVDAARELGIQGHVFSKSTVHKLYELFDGPVSRGWGYLHENAKACDSVTSSGVTFADNFAKLLILDSLADPTLADLVDLRWGSRTSWNFFQGEAALVPEGVFPDDLDTTSLALTVLQPPSAETVPYLLDLMAGYVNSDGTFQTYFDRDRHRVDPIVSANVLACFYSFGRGHEFERTLRLVRSVLLDRSYMEGTRYYPTVDCCLGFIARLLRSSSNPHLHETLGPLLESRLRERLGHGGSAMDLAMRIIACSQMGIACQGERGTLLQLQCADGSWEPGWMYRYGSTGVKVGNRAVTTAMAVAALSCQEAGMQGEEGGAKPLLLPLLAKTAASAPTASVRIAWAASIAVHVGSPKPQGMVIDDTGKPTDEDVTNNYGQTKVGNVFLARELAKTTPQTGVVHVAFNPGNPRTELQRHWTGLAPWITDKVILFGSIPEGVEHSLKGEAEGGCGIAEKFMAWCGQRTEAFL